MKAPLGFDSAGNPLDIPEAATAWRVRRALGRPGRPQTVYDPETGRQLELAITATLDDLRAFCPPARYRLEAIDAENKALVPSVLAFVELVPLEEEAASEEEAPRSAFEHELVSGDRAMKTIERQAESMARSIEALARAFGPVQPAPGGADPAELAHHLVEQRGTPSPAQPIINADTVQAIGLLAQQLMTAWVSMKKVGES